MVVGFSDLRISRVLDVLMSLVWHEFSEDDQVVKNEMNFVGYLVDVTL